MRTTIRFDPHLLKEAKKYAASQHKTLTAVLEDALREVLARSKSAPQKIELPISRNLGGALPGVDLIKTSTLLDPLEKYIDPS